jgi:hypothetical protein
MLARKRAALFAVAIALSSSVAAEQFSIAIIPDSQRYSEAGSVFLPAQTGWVVAERATRNIVYVAHLGDLKNHFPSNAANSCDDSLTDGPVDLDNDPATPPVAGLSEWDYVDQSMAILEDATTTRLAEGIPYGVHPGNHDFDQDGNTCPDYLPDHANGRLLGTFNSRFGDARFSPGGTPRGYYGGMRACDDDGTPSAGDPTPETYCNTTTPAGPTGDSYSLFNFCDIGFIVINLSYRAELAPASGASLAAILAQNPEFAWTNQLLSDHADRLAIVVSHFILEENPTVGGGIVRNQFSNWAEGLYNAIDGNPNLFMMLGAHERGEGWRVETRTGMQPVHALMANWQDIDFAGSNFTAGTLNEGNDYDSGLMRLMNFDTDTGMVTIDSLVPPIDLTAGAGTRNGLLQSTRTVTLDIDDNPNPQLDDETASRLMSIPFTGYGATRSTCDTGPADIVLTMDRSGSMSSASAVPTFTSKMEALQSAADVFLDQVAFEGLHRVGMVQFNAANSDLVDSVGNPVGDTLTAINTGNVGLFQDAVDEMSPGGWTNIVGGLDAANSMLALDPSPSTRQVVVLFTDGRHNRPLPVPADLAAAFAAEVDLGRQLYSLGFGTDLNDGPLSAAATIRNGWHMPETDPLGLAKDYSMVAARVMNNSTLLDPIYNIVAGGSVNERIGVSLADRDLTVVALWDTPNPEQVRLSLQTPGECRIDAATQASGVRHASGDRYRMMRVRLPHTCNGWRVRDGDWQVRLEGSREIRKAERVSLLVFSSSDIDLEASASIARNELRIDARLVGERAAKADFTAYLLQPVPRQGDSTLADRDGTAGSDLPPLVPVSAEASRIPMAVTAQRKGVIEASTANRLKNQGLYRIRVVAELVDSDGNKLRREAIATVFNPVRKTWPWHWVLIAVVALLVIVVGWRFVSSRRGSLTTG